MAAENRKAPNLEKTLSAYDRGLITFGEFYNQFHHYLDWHIQENSLGELHPLVKQLCRSGVVDWPSWDCTDDWQYVLAEVIRKYGSHQGLPNELGAEEIAKLKKALTPRIKAGRIYRVLSPLDVRVQLQVVAPATIIFDRTLEVGTVIRQTSDVMSWETEASFRPWDYYSLERDLVGEDVNLPEYRGYYLVAALRDIFGKCEPVAV